MCETWQTVIDSKPVNRALRRFISKSTMWQRARRGEYQRENVVSRNLINFITHYCGIASIRRVSRTGTVAVPRITLWTLRAVPASNTTAASSFNKCVFFLFHFFPPQFFTRGGITRTRADDCSISKNVSLHESQTRIDVSTRGNGTLATSITIIIRCSLPRRASGEAKTNIFYFRNRRE